MNINPFLQEVTKIHLKSKQNLEILLIIMQYTTIVEVEKVLTLFFLSWETALTFCN